MAPRWRAGGAAWRTGATGERRKRHTNENAAQHHRRTGCWNGTRKRRWRRGGTPLARPGGPAAITAPKLRCRVGEQHGALARTREGIRGATRVAAGSDPEPEVLSPLPTLTTIAATARRSRRVRLGRNRATSYLYRSTENQRELLQRIDFSPCFAERYSYRRRLAQVLSPADGGRWQRRGECWRRSPRSVRSVAAACRGSQRRLSCCAAFQPSLAFSSRPEIVNHPPPGVNTAAIKAHLRPSRVSSIEIYDASAR